MMMNYSGVVNVDAPDNAPDTPMYYVPEGKEWPYSNFSPDEEDNVGLDYTIIHGEAMIVGYYNNYEEIYVPRFIDGYKVTAIGKEAFAECGCLEYGLSYSRRRTCRCEPLISIIIPNSVTYIDDDAFDDCQDLCEIWVEEDNPAYDASDDTLHIKDYDVIKAKKEQMDTPDEKAAGLSYRIISGAAKIMKYKGDKTEIAIPQSIYGYKVTAIGKKVFYGCKLLTSVTIPESVTEIAYEAFDECKGLQEIRVAESNEKYKDIDGVLFSKDASLLVSCPQGRSGAYRIPDGTKVIGYRAFHSCISLTDIVIPESVTHIENTAFSGCSSLKKITVPEGVTHIGSTVFFDCELLNSVTLPQSVINIGNNSFGYSKKLKNIRVAENNPVYMSKSGSLYKKDTLELVAYPEGRRGEFIRTPLMKMVVKIERKLKKRIQKNVSD